MPARGHIFRWDLDKTYLKTDFDTVRELVRTARQTAEERENVPGSGALIRAMRESAPAGAMHWVYFISGSPEQMRSVIEKKFTLDGIAPDGFVLKPTVSNLLRGRFRALREQVPYKLGALFHGRAHAPIGVKETLLGDDAESDAFVYSLYADVVSGQVDRDTLRDILRRAGAYQDQLDRILFETEAIVHEPAVQRILIHLDQLTPPAAFQDYFPRLVPIYNHLQTAVVLALDGCVAPRGIADVAGELTAKFGYDVQRLVNSVEDILRRQRAQILPESLDKLAAGMAEMRMKLVAEDPAADVLRRMEERVLYVKNRPYPKTPTEPPPRRNYVELLEREAERREESKRAKKLYDRVARNPAALPLPDPEPEAEPETEGA